MEHPRAMVESIRLLTLRELEEAGHGHPSTIWRRLRRGTFPRPLDIEGKPRWREATIRAYLLALADGCGAAEAARSAEALVQDSDRRVLAALGAPMPAEGH